MTAPLSHNQIKAFLLPIADWDYSQLSPDQIHHLLSPREQERFARFRPQSKKNEFIASRLLLRDLLSRYSSCNPSCTEAVPDDLGRPFWYENGVPIDLYFSLSHTKEMVCCTISKSPESGCDIESLQRRKYQGDLTERVMSSEELAVYENLAAQKQVEFFYRSWTLKEAYVKAVGQGLRISLTSLSFTHEALHHETFSVAPDRLGRTTDQPSFTMMSTQALPGYSLGIATSLDAPEISIDVLQLVTNVIHHGPPIKE